MSAQKYFLLLVGDCYYPSSSTYDWVGTFETEEEAQKYYSLMVNKRDWHEIVDLKEWIGGKLNTNWGI